MNRPARAVIAEDEPLLAADLQASLQRLWPGLEIVANVRHGSAAVEAALEQLPDVLFLDIRMPGMDGLEAAQTLAEEWPAGAPLPLLVFVTAYDEYALQAFDRAAVDYVVKPVRPDRLAQTCERLRAALRDRQRPASGDATAADARIGDMLAQLSALVGTAPAARLKVIQAGVGSATHLIPVADVVFFEAADKYVRVVTSQREYLIRTALRELLPQLDPDQFWQIHRGTVVRADAIASAVRDESGKVHLTLRDRPDKLVASRLYAHRFRPM